MHLLVINPNTTASMTNSIGNAAQNAALPGTFITATNPASGPASIQGPEDGKAALPGLFEVFDDYVQGDNPPDAVIIACFDDTGLAELRARSAIPVTGIGEAAYHTAAQLGSPFSVVTTLAVSIPVLETNIAAYGLAPHCAAVRASGVAVLELERDPESAFARIEQVAKAAISQDNSRSIVLGCAGMAKMADRLATALSIPVFEGISCAVALCEPRRTENSFRWPT